MDLKLKGQRALVTGSTSGIGKGMATKLLQEGVTVYINSFSQQELDDVREELLAVGDARFVKCDVTSTESVTQMMEQIYAEGPLDIIVNNVGWWRDCPFEEITDADWQRMFDLNFFGAVRTLRYVFPRMKERGYGRVLNVASEVAFKPSPDCVHYCAAKTAVVSLSRGLAEATRKTNVTVNSLVYARRSRPYFQKCRGSGRQPGRLSGSVLPRERAHIHPGPVPAGGGADKHGALLLLSPVQRCQRHRHPHRRRHHSLHLTPYTEGDVANAASPSNYGMRKVLKAAPFTLPLPSFFA